MKLLRLLAIVFLSTLLLLLVLVTRLYLPSIQFSLIDIEMNQLTQSSDKRSNSLDVIILSELAVAESKAVTKKLQASEKIISIPRLWVDQCEVSQLAFNKFIDWYQQQATDDTRDRIKAIDEPKQWHYASNSTAHQIAGRGRSPASGVSYYDAHAYCAAAGGRLPVADERQAIAGGRNGRLYPWGNNFAIVHTGAWPYRDADLNASQSCGLFPKNDTPHLVHDLANGAMEWTAPAAEEDINPTTAPVFGAIPGEIAGRPLYALNALSYALPRTLRSHLVGFRCVYQQKALPVTLWGTPNAQVAIDSGEYRIGLPAKARLPKLLEILPPEEIRALLDDRKSSSKPDKLSVSRCEVTRQHYRNFLSDPLVTLGLFANEAQPKNISYIPQLWEEQLQQPELPVVGIHWWAANAFTRWVGGRLPTKSEWVFIAAGNQANDYPWGKDYRPNNNVDVDLDLSQLHLCADYKLDSTIDGIKDMASNASEWSSSIAIEGGKYLMWVKGGSYLLPAEETAEVTFERALPLEHQSADIGFRVVFD